MKPEELGGLIFGVCLIENDLNPMTGVVDLMKLMNAIEKQDVGFGNFTAIFAESSLNIIHRFHEIVQILINSTQEGIDLLKSILDERDLKQESPFGTFVQTELLALGNYPLISLPHLFNSFQKWISNDSAVSLPTLLSPDDLFSFPDSCLIVSPVPSTGCPVPSLSELESFLSEHCHNSCQSLLYLALLHAKQRKTSLALNEITQFCLKMTETADDSTMTRSSVALSQVFDLLEMKDDSLKTLKESIDGAKTISDAVVLSTAVALKAKIENKHDSWKHAASLRQPHPTASVRSILESGGPLSEALKIDPFLAAEAFSTKEPVLATILPLTEKSLPQLVLQAAENADWKRAAGMIQQLNIGRIEVRSTALALSIAFLDANNQTEQALRYREDLADIMGMEIGYFDDLKPTIRSISDIFVSQITKNQQRQDLQKESENPGLPYDKTVIERLLWMSQYSDSPESCSRTAQLANKYQVTTITKMMIEKLQKFHSSPDDIHFIPLEIVSPLEDLLLMMSQLEK